MYYYSIWIYGKTLPLHPPYWSDPVRFPPQGGLPVDGDATAA